MKKKSLKLIIFLFMLLIIPINVKADEKVKFSITKDQDNLKPGYFYCNSKIYWSK